MNNIRFGVLGGTGFLGGHVTERLQTMGLPTFSASRRTNVDARKFADVVGWIMENDLTHVINLAAECGGIGLNQRAPADLWLASMQINATVLDAARYCNLQKLTLIGTACSYAALAPTPFKEDDLMYFGFPEYTNSAYGVAKLATYFGARAYRDQYGLNSIYLVPVNLYGPYDHFNPDTSHVIAALIERFVQAEADNTPVVVVWGTGKATREFLYAADAADGIIHATMEYNDKELVNLGSGSEVSIRDLTTLIADLTGYKGEIVWDSSKPDGQMRRCLDTTRATERLGWTAQTDLRTGLAATIDWYKNNKRGQNVRRSDLHYAGTV